MPNPSKPKRIRNSEKTRAKWQQHVDAQQASGLTQAAYCQAHGLNSKYFCLWKRKLKQPEVDGASTAATSAEAVATTLIPVSVKPVTATPMPSMAPPCEHQVMVRLPNGIALEWRVPAGQNISDLIVELARLPC